MVVLWQVNRKGPVTGHRVRGAVAGYLLLGLSCAYAYALIDFLIPGAFQMPAADLQSRKAQSDAFLYFSIVTLTTLGYGDITAVHPVARSVVMIEALLGQLDPAILIARLVTCRWRRARKGIFYEHVNEQTHSSFSPDPASVEQKERNGNETFGVRLSVLSTACSGFSSGRGRVLCLSAGCQKEEKAAGPPAPPAVEVVEVVQKDVPIYSEWVGTMDGIVNATIRPYVTGYLVKQNYKEGDFVKKRQVLFEIDPRTFQATVGQAKGRLDQASATLEQSKAEVAVEEARWTTARANLARIKPLAEQNAVSQKDLDDAVGVEQSTRASVLAAQAAVVAARASVVAAQAALDKAQLDLDFTRILSPIDGIAGMAKAQIGNLVGPGSTEELTTVSTVDPIKVYVSLSEQEYLKRRETELERKRCPSR